MTCSLSSVFVAFLIISICECQGDVKCGSGHVLESTSLTVYELEDEEISVHAKDLSGTKPQWSVPKSLFGLVSLLYRRLVISNVSQFADGWVKYNLVTDEKETIYSSARAYFHVGKFPALSLTPTSSSLLKVNSGDSASICFVPTGTPHPIVTLYKKSSSSPINTSANAHPRFHILNSCLEINSATYDERGSYTLKAENCFGSLDLDFRLKVFVKPTVTINFHAATGYLSVSPETSIIGMVSGGDLVLPYQVSGSPKPTHEWLHLNSTPISIIHSNFNESHLTLRIVSQSDSGIYKVVVRNSLGEAEASFSLSVQTVRRPEPIPTVNTDDRDLLVGSSRAPTRAIHDDVQSEETSFPWWIVVVIVCGVVILLVVIVIVVICMCKSACCGQTCENSKKGDVLEPADIPSGSWKNEAPVSSVGDANGGPTEVLSESNSIFSGVRYHSLVPESFNNGYDHITPKDNQFCYEVPQEDEPTYAEVPDDTVEPESDIVSDAADPHYKSPKGSHDRSNDQVADDVSHDYDYVADDEQDQPADRRRSQYACVDKGRKKVRDPAASYSLVDKSSKYSTTPYADLDENALEEPVPPRPRYEAVQYSEVNPVQPTSRQE